jgi:hypothetical protein
LGIPAVATAASDDSRPLVQIDRDLCEGVVGCIFLMSPFALAVKLGNRRVESDCQLFAASTGFPPAAVVGTVDEIEKRNNSHPLGVVAEM